MAQIDLDDLVQGDFAAVSVLNGNFTTVENELNGNITNDNISASANIDPAKINGGAITNFDVTEVGEAGKIPKIDDSGMIVVSGISFDVGLF